MVRHELEIVLTPKYGKRYISALSRKEIPRISSAITHDTLASDGWSNATHASHSGWHDARTNVFSLRVFFANEDEAADG